MVKLPQRNGLAESLEHYAARLNLPKSEVLESWRYWRYLILNCKPGEPCITRRPLEGER